MALRPLSLRAALLTFVTVGAPLAAIHCAAAPATDADAIGEAAEALPKGPGNGDPNPDPLPPKPIRTRCYYDRDHDGAGGAAITLNGSTCPAPYVYQGGDCDDTTPNVKYGATCYRDADGDGQVGTANGTTCGDCPAGQQKTADDCNDNDANVYIRYCAFDSDKDGYASNQQQAFCASSCGAVGAEDAYDWRSHASDCNDTNAAVHPEQRETPANGIDDDCNGLADEATFSYFADSSTSTTSGLRIWYNVNDGDIIDYARNVATTIYAIAKYAPLTNTAAVATSAPLATTVYTGGNPPFGYFDLPNLAEGTVYRVTVRFARNADGSGLFTDRGHYVNPSFVLDEYAASAPYFNATQSTRGALMAARMKVVNKAFHELHDGEIGLVKDGNRYCSGYDCNLDAGGKPLHHEWCSEFYNSMITDQFNSVNPLTPWLDYDVTNVRGVFVSRGTWHPFQAEPYGATQILQASPGDFIADGVPTISHSTMFIARDFDGRPWTLSGNDSNRVGFGKMIDADIHSVINGIGTLTEFDLKN